VVIELGGNDGLRGYPTQKLRANLARMTQLSRAAGANVIIVPMEIPPNYGPRYTSAFRATFAQVASEEGAALAPFILEDIATQASLMQEDGIHPTVDAQPQLLENMLPTILAEMEKL
jgi:acyl-CoA thioesterase-1